MGDRWATCTTGAACLRTRDSRKPQPLELRFRALLTEGGTEPLEFSKG
jgi:hypothetical protein